MLYLSLNFTVGQTEACYSLNITDDDICETENFFASLEDTSGTMSVLIHPSDTQVNIDDTNESECGKLCRILLYIYICHLIIIIIEGNLLQSPSCMLILAIHSYVV